MAAATAFGGGRGGPAVWGPAEWNRLHNLAIAYPEDPTPDEARAAFYQIWALARGLPCGECRVHATEYLQRRRPDLSNSQALQLWAWNFHNAVNTRLGKALMPFDAYLAAYSDELRAAAARAVGRRHRRRPY